MKDHPVVHFEIGCHVGEKKQHYRNLEVGVKVNRLHNNRLQRTAVRAAAEPER